MWDGRSSGHALPREAEAPIRGRSGWARNRGHAIAAALLDLDERAQADLAGTGRGDSLIRRRELST